MTTWPTRTIRTRRVGLVHRWDLIDHGDLWQRSGYRLTSRAAYRAARNSMREGPSLWTRPLVLLAALLVSLAIWAGIAAAIVAAT